MTELMEKAWKALLELSPEQQEAIAQSVLAMIGENASEPVDVPDDHKAAIDEAIDDLERGNIVSYEEMKSIYATYRA